MVVYKRSYERNTSSINNEKKKTILTSWFIKGQKLVFTPTYERIKGLFASRQTETQKVVFF